MGRTLASLIGTGNLQDPIPSANKEPTILGVVITLEVLAWLCGLLRLWTRWRVIKSAWWDDFFVGFSLLTTLTCSATICVGATTYGLGKHFVLLGRSGMQSYLVIFYIANATYVFSTALIKIALLLQYLRIFERRTTLHTISMVMLGIVSLWGLAFFILAWFPCSPVDAYWKLQANAKCWGFAAESNVDNLVATYEAHTSINMILDIAVLAIPVPLYFRPGAASKTRWGILGLLFLGVISTAASIARLVTIVKHKAATYPQFDPSWYGCISIILATVEVNVAVIAASIPVFWPVLRTAGFQIFVTKEIQITSESRLDSRDIGDDGVELHHAGMPPAGAAITTGGQGRRGSSHSHAGSDTTLQQFSSRHSSDDKLGGYYGDRSFTRNQHDAAVPNSRTRPNERYKMHGVSKMV